MGSTGRMSTWSAMAVPAAAKHSSTSPGMVSTVAPVSKR